MSLIANMVNEIEDKPMAFLFLELDHIEVVKLINELTTPEDAPR